MQHQPQRPDLDQTDLPASSSQAGCARCAWPCPLDLDCAPNGINDADKFRQEAIAGVLDDPAPVLRDLRIDQLPKMGFFRNARS